MRRKGIVIVLLLAILLPIFCVAPQVQATEVQAAQTDLHGTIEEQIRAYADSIDQKDAVATAAMAMALHGISGNGKRMYADEDNALAAVLINSKLLQVNLSEVCSMIIGYMGTFAYDQLYARGETAWLEGRNKKVAYIYSDVDFREDDMLKPAYNSITSNYNGTLNSYDYALTWMAGDTGLYLTVTRNKVTEDTAIYDVSLRVLDKFDFSGEYHGKDEGVIEAIALLGSALGKVLFREYDWELNLKFQLEVPAPDCGHGCASYHWVYDAESKQLISDDTEVFLKNPAKTMTVTAEDGTVNYYQSLARTVRLIHDRPWVMEYKIQGISYFVFSALETPHNGFPMLFHMRGKYLFGALYARKTDGRDPWDLHGVDLRDVQTQEESDTYIYRLENVVGADGSNMVWLSIYNQTQGQKTLEPTPMTSYFTMNNEIVYDKKKHETSLDGRDLIFNFIGTTKYHFDPAAFELTIWENGIDGGNRDYFVDEKVKATCSTPGGVRHTCQACGYTYYSDETPALGHDWGSYKSNNDATCQKDGTKTATCKTCGEKKTVTDEGSQADHDWTPATCLYSQTCLTCGETQGELGDHDFAEATCTKPKTCKVCGETEGDCLPHSWLEPNCTDPKKCSGCGLTEGSALGHSWSGVTCQHANTCTVCGFVKGEPKEHTWVEATCTEAKHCAFCGTIEGEPLGHDFVGGGCTEAPVCSRCSEKGEPFGHTWTAADCYSARSCTVCGFADGVALGHSWIGPTCTEAKYCGVCAIVEGEPLGHIFADATCEMPSTCTGCGLTDGEPLGHDWIDADCENPKHCARCAATEGEPLGHTWTDASCTAPKTCTVCGKTEGAVLEHGDGDGDLACDHCGQDLRVPTEPMEPPATTTPTQTPTTVPPAAEPDNGEEESGNGLLWIICGIALAAIGAVSIGLILRKKKN